MKSKGVKSGSYWRFNNAGEINSFLFYLLLISMIVIPRWYYVERYGLDFPFYDQWDAEGEGVIHPLLAGNFRFTNLWLTHNEHRVFPTRLITFFLFKITGVWSCLSEARFNVMLAASIPVLLIGFMRYKKELYGFRWLVVLVAVAQFTLPFGWENLLIGFQSQFFFLILFAMTGVFLAAMKPDKIWAFVLIFVLSLLSIFTMASGILMPFTIAGVYIFYAILLKTNYIKAVTFALLLMLIGIAGYCIMPQVENHNKLHAESFEQFFLGLTQVLSWPAEGNRWIAIPLWLPAVMGIPILVLRKHFTSSDLVMAGCFAWTLAQIVAISYGRGHELAEVTSRYRDLLSLGLVSVSWFSLRLTYEFRNNIRVGFLMIVLAIGFYSSFVKNHIIRFGNDVRTMKNQHALMLVQVGNAVAYYQTRNKSALDKPAFQLPYPDKVRLQQMLDDSSYCSVIPLLNRHKTSRN